MRWESALLVSPLLGVPGFPGMQELRSMLVLNASMQRCVCVFLLCHNDDVAAATMRTGASARAPSSHAERAWSQQPAENLWITAGGVGFWDSGINQ